MTLRQNGSLQIYAYRGYASRQQVVLLGQVARKPDWGDLAGQPGLIGILGRLARRALSRGIAEARIRARFVDTERVVKADRNGFFEVRIEPGPDLGAEVQWRPMQLELVEPAVEVSAEAQIFVPPASARFVVISDIDDTVMHTGVANKVEMLWRLFGQGAESRVAFAGVAAFYRALHRGGEDTVDGNPMLYVSRAPWSLYEVLDEFFNEHDIPVGPVLFLRDWGLTLDHPLPRRSKGHKLALIRHMLRVYENLPFLLIGDSGQRDAEIYAEVVREHRGRIHGVYIRDVGSGQQRRAAIGVLADQVAKAGSNLVLAADSFTMARDAADRGLIAAGALDEIRTEADAGGGDRRSAQP